MSIPAERQDLRLMRAMFSTIAPRYDFITRIFSYGMDRRWKRRGVQMANLPERRRSWIWPPNRRTFRGW